MKSHRVKKGVNLRFLATWTFPPELRRGDLVTQIFSGRPGGGRMCSENMRDVVESQGFLREFSLGQIRGGAAGAQSVKTARQHRNFRRAEERKPSAAQFEAKYFSSVGR